MNSIPSDCDYNDHFEPLNRMSHEIDKNDFMISLKWLRVKSMTLMNSSELKFYQCPLGSQHSQTMGTCDHGVF